MSSWWDVLDTTLCDKVCQWLARGRRFSQGNPDSSNNKTDRHDITGILLKVALNIINQAKPLLISILFQTGVFVEGFLIRNKTLIYLGGHLAKGRGKVCIVLYWLIQVHDTTLKIIDRATRTPLKPVVGSGAPEGLEIYDLPVTSAMLLLIVMISRRNTLC